VARCTAKQRHDVLCTVDDSGAIRPATAANTPTMSIIDTTARGTESIESPTMECTDA
jgi:hypothetical protein